MSETPPKQIRSFAVGSSIGEILVHDGEDAAMLAECSPLVHQLGNMVGNALGMEAPKSVLLIGKSLSTFTLENGGNYYTALFEGMQSRPIEGFLNGLTDMTEALKGDTDA